MASNVLSLLSADNSPFAVPEPPTADTVFLHRDGRTLEVSLSSVTPKMVSRAFNLDVSTVWLKERTGQRAFFPVNDTEFQFTSDVPALIYTFNVEGTTGTTGSGPSGSSLFPAAVSFATGASSTFKRPLTAAAKNQSVNVKIIQAKMSKSKSGKPEFTNISLEYVAVTEATANVQYLSSVVQSKWGCDHILVSADGLQLEDSSATQGCQSCVDKWYAGDTAHEKACPRCRAHRGFAETCRLNGMDELLSTLRSVLGTDEDEEPE